MIKTTVIIRGKNAHKFIEVSMEEYIKFIRGQATMLGITKKEEQPISYIEFGELKGIECIDCGMCDEKWGDE